MGCAESVPEPIDPPTVIQQGLPNAMNRSSQVSEKAKILETKDVKLGRQIGTGSFKNVFEADVAGLGKVAVLRFRRQGQQSSRIIEGGWPREAKALMAIGKHSHIASLLGMAEDPDGGGWMLVQALAPLGPLDAFLDPSSGRTAAAVTLHHRYAICHQMAHALVVVAAAGFAHGDVAARNVLVYELSATECQVKLTDFGNAVKYRDSRPTGQQTSRTPTRVALRWMPPEVMLDATKVTDKADVWSFGVLGWELFNPGQLPFAVIDDDARVSAMVSNGERLERPESCPEMLWHALCVCWAPIPEARPTAADVRKLVHCTRVLLTQAEALNKPIPTCDPTLVLNAALALSKGSRQQRPEFEVQSAIPSFPLPHRGFSLRIANLLWIALEYVQFTANAEGDAFSSLNQGQAFDPEIILEHFRVRYRAEEATMLAEGSSTEAAATAGTRPANIAAGSSTPRQVDEAAFNAATRQAMLTVPAQDVRVVNPPIEATMGSRAWDQPVRNHGPTGNPTPNSSSSTANATNNNAQEQPRRSANLLGALGVMLDGPQADPLTQQPPPVVPMGQPAGRPPAAAPMIAPVIPQGEGGLLQLTAVVTKPRQNSTLGIAMCTIDAQLLHQAAQRQNPGSQAEQSTIDRMRPYFGKALVIYLNSEDALAKSAGIKNGDLLVAVNGTNVNGDIQLACGLLASLPPGRPASLDIRREPEAGQWV